MKTRDAQASQKGPEAPEPPGLSEAAFHILLAVAEEERHGYGIMREVERRTAGRVRLGPGTLYGSLKRLLGAGWIEETATRPDLSLDDERRRYYRLTPAGRQIAAAEVRRLQQMLAAARVTGLLDDASAT